MPTAMESLLSEHATLLQKIIDQAKKDALSTQSMTSGTSGTTSTSSLDLLTHINSSLDNLIKEKKDKNILTPYANPYNWPRNNNCWAKSLDLSGYSACIVPLGGVGGGTLITRKHVLITMLFIVQV